MSALPSMLDTRDLDVIQPRYSVPGTSVVFVNHESWGGRIFWVEDENGVELDELTAVLRAEFYTSNTTAATMHAIARRIQARYL